ncbi:hypothetical protein Tco_0226433 [Tanacetum coccineum]
MLANSSQSATVALLALACDSWLAATVAAALMAVWRGVVVITNRLPASSCRHTLFGYCVRPSDGSFAYCYAQTVDTLLMIGIRALSYRELGCISNMSNSEKLRHTDNTTLVPPRLLDTVLQVYHRRRPTLGLLILLPVSPFPPTIRRTARISVLPIEPNLAEHARISAINLDDYQLDPLTPLPSPLSPFSMAAYQWMTAKTDPT